MSATPASAPMPELSAAPDRKLQRDLRLSLAAAVLGVGAFALLPHPHVEAELLAAMRRGLTLWTVLPFVGLLGCIAILDNAPTYLTMSAAASGLQGVVVEGRFLAELLLRDGGSALLVAISAGAVLMGANTYIGNGPNFMVKAVAEQRGVKMPSFFGYMAYSSLVLLPLFAGATLLFFRG